MRSAAPRDKQELLCSVEAGGVELGIVLSPDQEAEFLLALTTDFASIAKSLSAVDARKAKAFLPDDENMIRTAVANGCGFEELNKTVISKLREWLAESCRRAIEKLPPAERGSSALLSSFARMLYEQGKLNEAEGLMREGLEAMRKACKDEDSRVLMSTATLGQLLESKGEWDEAEVLYREALVISVDTGDESSVHTAKLRQLLARRGENSVTRIQQGTLNEEERWRREGLEAARKARKDKLSRMLVSISNLGQLLKTKGEWVEAAVLFRQALAISEDIGEKLDILVHTANLGQLLASRGVKAEEAEGLLELGIEMSREAEVEYEGKPQGDYHKNNTVVLQGNLASLLMQEGKLREAEPLMRDTMRDNIKLHGERHPKTLIAMTKLGQLLVSLGRPRLAEAETLLSEALKAKEETLKHGHISTLVSKSSWGQLLAEKGKWQNAEIVLREVHALKEEKLGEGHAETLASVINLGTLLVQQRSPPDEAEKRYREAVEKCARYLGDRHRNTLAARSCLGGLLAKKGQYSDAERELRAALTAKQEVLGNRNQSTLATMNNLGHVLHALDEHDEAEKLMREVLAACTDTLGDEHPHTKIASGNLGSLLSKLGKTDEAEPFLNKAGL